MTQAVTTAHCDGHSDKEVINACKVTAHVRQDQHYQEGHVEQ